MVATVPPRDLPPVPLSVKLEGNYGRLSRTEPCSSPQSLLGSLEPIPHVQRGTKLSKRRKQTRTLTSPVTSTPKENTPTRRFTFPRRPGGDTSEPKVDRDLQGSRIRPQATLRGAWGQLRTVARVPAVGSRLRKLRKRGSLEGVLTSTGQPNVDGNTETCADDQLDLTTSNSSRGDSSGSHSREFPVL